MNCSGVNSPLAAAVSLNCSSDTIKNNCGQTYNVHTANSVFHGGTRAIIDALATVKEPQETDLSSNKDWTLQGYRTHSQRKTTYLLITHICQE